MILNYNIQKKNRTTVKEIKKMLDHSKKPNRPKSKDLIGRFQPKLLKAKYYF